MMRILTAFALWLGLIGAAAAQSGVATNTSGLTTLINTNLADNTTGAITPFLTRQALLDMVASSVLGCVNNQTGVSYNIVTSDYGCLITLSNAAPIAVTIPAATPAAGFSPFNTFVVNKGAGTATITPATSLINGAATLALTTGQAAWIVSDGTNYQIFKTSVVGSVSNTDGTLTISPTTGAVIASLNLAHANTWTAAQTFSSPILNSPTINNPVLTVGSDALGDIYYNSGSNLLARLAVGSNGQCLTVAAGIPSYGSCSGVASSAAGASTNIQFNSGGILAGNNNLEYFGNGSVLATATSGNTPTITTRLTTDSTQRTIIGLDTSNTAYIALGKGSAGSYTSIFSEANGIGGETELGFAGQAQSPAQIGGTGRLWSGLHLYRLADTLPGGGTNYRRAGIGWFATDSLNITLESAGSLVGVSGGINLTADATPAGGLSNTINASTSFAPPAAGGSVTTITNGANALVTVTGNHFFNGETVLFSGTLPTGISALTTYDVCALSGSNFNIATSFANCTNAVYVTTSSNFVGPATVTPGAQVTTITVASPAIVSVDHHNLLPGTGIIFATNGGTLPTCSPALNAGTTYFVFGSIAGGVTVGDFEISTAALGGSLVNCSSGSMSGNVTYTLDSTQNGPPGGGGLTISTPDAGGGTNSGNEFIFSSLWNASPLDTTAAHGPVLEIELGFFNAPPTNNVFGIVYGNSGTTTFGVDVAGRMTNTLARICTTAACPTLTPVVSGQVQMITSQAAAGTGALNYPVIALKNLTTGNNKSGLLFIDANGANDWQIQQYSNGDTVTADLLFAQANNNVLDMNGTTSRFQLTNFWVLGWCSGAVSSSCAADTGFSRASAGTVALGNGTILDTSGTLQLANINAGTVTPLQIGGSASFSANNNVATVLGSIGPTGSHTTVQKWLTIKDNGGNTLYIPAF